MIKKRKTEKEKFTAKGRMERKEKNK